MRGCLTILLLAAAFLVGGLWFGGPPLAGAVVQASLTGSGFRADDLRIVVSADPPLKLALGRADRVAIDATGVHWNSVAAGSLSLVLGQVDLVGRTAATASGTIDRVELTGSDAAPVFVRIALSGPAQAAPTTISVEKATIEGMARAGFRRAFKIDPDVVELIAPNLLRVGVAGKTLTGRLAIDQAGALVAASDLGTIRLVEPNPSIPLKLTSVSVEAAGLELLGTLDVAALIH